MFFFYRAVLGWVTGSDSTCQVNDSHNLHPPPPLTAHIQHNPEQEAESEPAAAAQSASFTIHCIMLRENTAEPWNWEPHRLTFAKSTKQNNSWFQRESSKAALDINQPVHRDERPAAGELDTTNFQFSL